MSIKSIVDSVLLVGIVLIVDVLFDGVIIDM